MVLDSFQRRFVMNMQLRQCFFRSKPFLLKKARFCLAFFDFQKKPKVFKKSQNFKNLASKNSSWQPCAKPPTRLAQVRSSILCLQRQVAKLASGLLYSWSLLRNSNTAINLQMFTSSYGSRRFGARHGTRAPTEGFSTQICFFSRPVCLGYYEKSCDICVF